MKYDYYLFFCFIFFSTLKYKNTHSNPFTYRVMCSHPNIYGMMSDNELLNLYMRYN